MEDEIKIYFTYEFEIDTAIELLEAYGEWYERINEDLLAVTPKGLEILEYNDLECHIFLQED